MEAFGEVARRVVVIAATGREGAGAAGGGRTATGGGGAGRVSGGAASEAAGAGGGVGGEGPEAWRRPRRGAVGRAGATAPAVLFVQMGVVVEQTCTKGRVATLRERTAVLPQSVERAGRCPGVTAAGPRIADAVRGAEAVAAVATTRAE